MIANKPIGARAYGSIPHLPGSRMGPADHHCHEGQARICLEQVRDKHDFVVVQEKTDGSCVAVANVGGQIVALGRAGYLAQTSPYEQHQLFADWVRRQESRFDFLSDGERLVGEWLAQAHGTKYALTHEPFVAFDLMRGKDRTTHAELDSRLNGRFVRPRVLGTGPMPMSRVLELIATSGHGALDPVEGAVWRVERKGKVDFLAKWVRSDKVDGKYLPERNGGQCVWNWRPL